MSYTEDDLVFCLRAPSVRLKTKKNPVTPGWQQTSDNDEKLTWKYVPQTYETQLRKLGDIKPDFKNSKIIHKNYWKFFNQLESGHVVCAKLPSTDAFTPQLRQLICVVINKLAKQIMLYATANNIPVKFAKSFFFFFMKYIFVVIFSH